MGNRAIQTSTVKTQKLLAPNSLLIMHWTVVSSFLTDTDPYNWLTPYVPGTRHQFQIVPRSGENTNWHDRKSPVTTSDEWQQLWQQSGEAWRVKQDGVITILPQLAALIGLRKRFSFKRVPVVAWWFNTNRYSGLKELVAQNSLKSIDCFVVHNRCEIDAYSQWFKIPHSRFEFVPLQVGEIPITEAEDTDEPFIVATGSAYRDYPTLFEAVKKLNLRTIVISGPRSLEGLTIPPQVETPFGMKKDEIRRLVQRARINIVPMVTEGLTAGTVTVAETLRMGRPMIATRRNGVNDYIKDGENGILVNPNSVDDLAQAIDRLWNDAELRDRLSKSAYHYGQEHLSDQAAGASLGHILDRFAS